MIPMSIEGVRRNFTTSSPFFYSVFLLDETQKRLLVFNIERYEAIPIVAALHNIDLPRPQAIHVATEGFTFLGYTLEEALIENFSPLPPLYHLCTCTLCWRNGEAIRSQHITIRPGDVIALALLLKAQLFVSEPLYEQSGVPLREGQTPETVFAHHLLARAGVALPEGKTLRLGYSKTLLLDALLKEVKSAVLGKEPLFPEADMERRKQEYIDFLLAE
jgi:bifunctional DNase/RNase